MKILLLLTVLLSASFAGHSTETRTLNFSHKNIELNLTYNDGTHFNNDKLQWYYDGLSKQLSAYIASRNVNKAAPLKFTIDITLFYATSCQCCPVEFKKTKNECQINILEKEYSLDQLTQLVDYFYHPKWKAFTCTEAQMSNDTVFTITQKKVDSIVPPQHYTFYDKQSTTVYQTGGLKIDYEKDSLILKIDNQPIPININFTSNSIIPQGSENLYFAADDDSIYVIKKLKIVNAVWLPPAVERYSQLDATKEWMIYSERGMPRIIYSVSTDEFYRIDEK